jgi:hypothetical protein
MFVTVIRILVIVLVRMCELLVSMFMNVLLMWVLWGCARGVRMLMMRVVRRVRVGVCHLLVGVGMSVFNHIHPNFRSFSVFCHFIEGISMNQSRRSLVLRAMRTAEFSK